MAKINDTTIYVPKTNPKLADYLVGTDSESEVKQTVNFRLSDLKALFGANNILSGSVPPVPATGNDGDFYIDHVSWVLYGPKIAGNWPSGISVVGVKGEDGTNITPKGSKPQYADLPTEGNTQGDLWFVEEDGKLYSWDSDSGNWIDLGVIKGPQGPSGIVEVGENENITDATHQDYGKTLTYDADEKKISGNIHSIINEIIPYLGTTYLLDEDGKAIVDENGDFISEIDYDEVAEKLEALLTSLEGGQLGQILTKVNHENFNFIWNTPLIDTNSVIIPIEFPEDTDSPAPDEAEVLAVENKYIRVRRFTGEESTKVSFDFSPPHDMDFTKPIWCRLKGISEISGGVDEYNAVVFSVTGKVLPNDLATPTTSFTTSITYIVPQITDPEFFTTVWEDFIITEGSLDNDVHDYSIQIDLKREYFYGSDAHYTESIAISEIEIKYTKR